MSKSQMTALEKKRKDKLEEEKRQQEELEKLIPHPVGYMILVAIPQVEATYQGSSLLKADSSKHREFILSMCGLVLELGNQCYKDKDRYPEGPWCKEGDYVLFRPNSGTRFVIGSQEYRLLNDDNIEAVVPDPRVIMRPS